MNQLCANTLSNFFVLFFLLCNWCLPKPKVWSCGRRDSFIGVCASSLSFSHLGMQSWSATGDSCEAELSGPGVTAIGENCFSNLFMGWVGDEGCRNPALNGAVVLARVVDTH